jgi:FkbM family methyltransferase
MRKIWSNGWTGGWAVEEDSGRKVCYSKFNPSWMIDLHINPQVIFDVGSFDGADAVRLKRAFPAAHVVSVEGDPIRAAAIRQALQGRDITLVEAVVYDRVGEVDWYQGGDRSELGSKNGSIFRWAKKPPTTPARLKCDTLANICSGLGITFIDLTCCT